MTAQTTDFRTRESDAPHWWRKMSELERSVILIAIIAIMVFTTLYWLAQSIGFVDDFAANIITEVISVAITVAVIERLNREDADRRRKEELRLQMGSLDNGFALEAVRLLRRNRCLTDGSMEGMDLRAADLKGAPLKGANLPRTNLGHANLENADIIRGNLYDANLGRANLQKAKLNLANLVKASLWGANMQGSILEVANLQDATLVLTELQNTKMTRVSLQGALLGYANFSGADLTNADLRNAIDLDKAYFDEETILPDGTRWSTDTDLERFTNPEHPDFWKVEDTIFEDYWRNQEKPDDPEEVGM